jgi:hypothetical protein
MGILRNLFGNVTSGLVRLMLAAGVFFLCYLLIVKPLVKTTDDAFHASGLDRLGRSLQHVGPQIEREVKRTLKLVEAQGGNTQRLVKCVKHADQNTEKLERCTRRF